MVFPSEEKSKKDGLDALTVGKVGLEQNMEQEERRGKGAFADTPHDFENPVRQQHGL